MNEWFAACHHTGCDWLDVFDERVTARLAGDYHSRREKHGSMEVGRVADLAKFMARINEALARKHTPRPAA